MFKSKFWNKKTTMTAYYGTTSNRHHVQIIPSQPL